MGRLLSVTENGVQCGFKAIKVYLLGGDGKHRAKAPLLVPLGAKEAHGRIEEEGSLLRRPICKHRLEEHPMRFLGCLLPADTGDVMHDAGAAVVADEGCPHHL